MAKMMKRSTTEDESSPGSSATSSSEDIEETARRKRRRPARRKTSKKKRSYSQGKEIMNFLAEFKEEVCKQAKQAADESKEEMSKQLEKLRDEMRKQSKQVTESKEMYKLREEMWKQSKQATESKEEICKRLEKVNQDNQEMRKQLTEILTDLRKQWVHTSGSSGDDSDAPRSQSNQVHPPRYRLVFKSGAIDKIDKGQPFDISVALVDGNDETVENGPLASATVELVVVKAEFNQHNNQYNWSREDFESNIKKAQQGSSATIDVDQSLKSIVSDGRFNLVQGVKCHSGSKIFRNSGNKKVRLGVMVVSPMEERVLEGLSNPFYVRGHDRLRHNNRPNMQSQSLVDDGYEEQNGAMSNMQNPSWANSTQYEETRLNITGEPPQFPIIGNTVMLSPALNITGGQQPQLPFLGNTMLSIEPSTNQDQEALIQQYQVPHLPMWEQATNNQTDELSAPMDGNVMNPNLMCNNYVPVQAIGMPYYTIQRTLPVRLIWDRLNVEPIKHCWNLHDHFSVTTVYKPSNRRLLPNSTRQLFMSRLSLKGQSLTVQTLSCTEKENCILLKGHLYQEELPDNLSMLCALRKFQQISDYSQLHRKRLRYMQNGIRSQEYMPLENIQWPHTLVPTLEAFKRNSSLLWRTNRRLCQDLTKLHLFGVMSCEELPQLCQLQVLQILCLEKLRSLCSHVVSMPFPELRELRLHDLESLEKWVATEGKEELIFPVLEKIVIKNCPKLSRLPEAPKLKDKELDKGMRFSSLTIQKEAIQTHQKRGGVLIELLEPDGLDERPTKTKRYNKYQFPFVNKVCKEYYTSDKIKADDGNLLKVALFDENNTKITSGSLSSASVKIIVLHGDFNVDGQDQDRWTSEEFSHSVVCPPPGEEASSLTGGGRVLFRAHGEACISHAFLQIPSSFVSRTEKFKMGVMVANAQDERIQEGISEPFWMMNRRVEDKNNSLLQTIVILYSILFLFLTSILLVSVRNILTLQFPFGLSFRPCLLHSAWLVILAPGVQNRMLSSLARARQL